MSKRGILIELTPLLDVIMIVMFLILVQSETRVDTLHAETQEAFAADLAAARASYDTAIADFEAYHLAQFAELDNLRGQVDELQGLLLALDEDAGIITLRHYSTFDDLMTRHIIIESPGNSARVDIVGNLQTNLNARDEATRELSAAITTQFSTMENEAAFILFIFDGNMALANDLDIIRLVMHNLRLHHGNVFSMEIDLR